MLLLCYNRHNIINKSFLLFSDVELRDIINKFPKRRLYASMGENSRSRAIYGKAGKDLKLSIPFGITVYDELGLKIGN